MKHAIYSAILLLTLFFAVTAQASKRAFAIEDIYKIKNTGAPGLSPDGSKILFTLSESQMAEGTNKTSIWIMNSDGNDQKEIIENGKSNYEPVWSMDGKSFFYTSTKDGVPQIYRYSLSDASSTKITDFSMGVSAPVISPDNRLIAFSAEVYPDCGADSWANAIADSLARNGSVQAYLANELLYRHWTDYSAGKYSHIILYDIEKQIYTDLTPGKFVSPVFMLGGGTGYAFSPDSKEICYVSNHDPHPEASTNADLFRISVNGGEAVNITAGNKAWDGWPAYSPDGKYIAFRRQLIPAYEADRFRLTLYNRESGEIKVVTEQFDNWVDDFKWSEDSRSIYFIGEVTGRQPLYKIDIASLKINNMSGEKSIFGFDLDTHQNLYFTASTTGKPVAMYKIKMPLGNEKQLTSFNEELENTVDIRPADTMWVAGADNKKLEVFLVKPHDFDPNKKYPLIINVHGGPQMQWMNSFRGDWQVYPAAGYVLAYPNPHGSTGYGQEFTHSISGDWGGKPFVDLMKVTDALANLSYVDSTRMGAMGWSYGGYMMNWFQAKTKRFKCLASMMGLYDLRSMWGTTEELWFPNYDLKGQPWNSELYKKFSPSEYVDNFATPTLVITGQRDFRVSYTQSVQYFSVLQTLGIPSRLIILANDGHWPSGVKSMPLYYNAHLEWFHEYLGGAPAPYNSEKLVRNQGYEKVPQEQH